MRYEHNQLKKLVKEIHFYTVVANSKNENDPHNSTAPQFSAENGLKVRRYQTQHENTNEVNKLLHQNTSKTKHKEKKESQ